MFNIPIQVATYRFSAVGLLSLIFNLTTAHLTMAQDFASEGTVWHYDYFVAMTFFGDGYVILEHDGDTVIQGAECQRLRKTIHYYTGITENVGSFVDFEHVRSQGDSVFVYRSGQFQLLYDFGGQPGDVWAVAGNDVCEEAGIVVVDSIGTEVIDGVALRYLHVSSPNSSPNQFTKSKIIERVGCVGYMFPEPMCMTDSDFGGYLRCYSDRDISVQFQTQIACDKLWTSGQDENQTPQPLTVRPTFFQDVLMVDAPETTKDLRFEICDLSGRVHRAGAVPANRIIRDLEGLNAGIYLIKLTDASRASQFRIIKQS